MAQAMKINVAETVKMGAAPAPLKDQKVQVTVPATELTYADPQAWKFRCDVAEFVGGNPQFEGKYDVTKLDKGLEYKVYYSVAMINHDVSSPVKLTLQLPNGHVKEIDETLTVERNKFQSVFVGKFLNKFISGDIKFTFSGVTGDTWKGLLLQHVLITADA